jgi:hypothetical protein
VKEYEEASPVISFATFHKPKKCISVFLMQACVEQKLSGSSFVGGYLYGITKYFDVSRLTVIDTQILHWRGFDAHVPACFSPVKCIFGVKRSS